MPKKRFSAEQIVTLLRQIEVLMAQEKAALDLLTPRPTTLVVFLKTSALLHLPKRLAAV